MDKFFNIGNFYIDLFSVIFVVFFLISMIVGAKRGFLRMLVKFLKVFAVMALAAFLCKPFGNIIFNWGLGNTLASKYEPSIVNINSDVFNTMVSTATSETEIQYGLSLLKIPSFLIPFVSKMVVSMLTETPQTLGHIVSLGLASYTTIAIAFVLLIIAGLIICAILNSIAKGIHNTSFFGAIDRILGLLLSAVICYIIIDAILFGLSFLVSHPEWGVINWISKTMYLDDPEVFTLSKFIYEHSITREIVSMFLNK